MNLRRSVVLLLCLSFWVRAFGANVIISEFVASNGNGLIDENGDQPDWIEIFNGGTNSVNLDGWYLTDSADSLTRWRFPSTNLAANGLMVVFASGKNRAVPGTPLHANFQLSAGGEFLALVMPDGVTIASAFSPQFPEQFRDISYGIGQNVQVTSLISKRSPAYVYVPANSTLGLTWTTTNFNSASWRAGTNGVGYENMVSGFAVKNIRANIGVCDLATADGVLANASQQAAVFTANPAVINYFNTGGAGNFGGDTTFPGLTINVDQDNFVTEATGIITIPTSGAWTFGVNSDDGFRCTIGANSFEYASPRGPGDTLATFTLAAGEYPVRLVFYECGGGSELEFFAASGSWAGFNASVFRLVGNTAGGGLAVKSLPISGSGGGSIRSLIATDIQTNLLNRNASAYVRMPFQVANPAAYASLTLRVHYDDGFVAYLNGTEVARRNAPATPAWNSTATAARTTASVLVPEDIDLTPRLNLLQTGANVLALHVLNVSATDGDCLIRAELMENKVLGLTNHYFATPTPGAFNGSGFYAFVDNLKFTPGRGWFESTNFFVTITSATPGITIRYTTNGAVPTPTSGLLYAAPGIPIAGTTLLRAVGYRDGFEPSELETHSYLFLDQVQAQSTNVNWVGGGSGNYTLDTNITRSALYGPTFKSDLLGIPTLSIVATWEDLFGPSGVWSNPQGMGVAWERPCSLEYLRPDGEKGFHINCGVRIQGGASRDMVPKHGLRVLFKTIYGPGKLDYPLYPDSPVQEFDTLTLHATFNDHWLWGGAAAQMQRDQWCRDTQNAMGGYGPHGTYVHVYLNGLYWGVYNVGEKGDASYAAHYLGGDKEEYDALNSDELIDGNSDAWNAMLAIADAGITNDVAYTNLAQMLNVPNFINYMLMNFYGGNGDWPWHNWNAARRRVPGGLWHFFSWDAEWTLGIGSDLNSDRTGVGISDGVPGRLYNALRAHPEFRRQFADHAQKHLFNHGALTPGPAQARWMVHAAELDRAIVGESARWGMGSYTRQTWLSAQANVLSWFPVRTAILLNQLRNAGLYPQLSAPAFAPVGGLVPSGYSLVLTNPNPAGAIYYTLDGADPRRWGGGLSSSARLYASPLVLEGAVFLRARVRDGTNWSALVEAPFYLVQDYGGLAVTEIMYDPPALPPYGGDDLEFLELKNTGTNTLDLSGLQFTSGITFTFTNGTRLAPGAFFVLARNAAAFALKYPGVTVHGLYAGRLNNSGEELVLSHLLGTNVFNFAYNNTVPWPITPNGYGFSLVRSTATADPGAPTNWRPSANLGGSPGADDPPAVIPSVVINEILTHTDPPQTDAIELHNPTLTTVNVGGWFLSDDPAWPRKFRIADDTTIAAGGFVVFHEDEFNPQPGVFLSFALNSQGESLFLFSGDPVTTNLTGYSHSFDYGAAANGVSFGRHVVSTGEEQWPALSALTLGMSNAAPRVGPVVISEVMYHPAPGYDEFVELYNLSSNSVTLFDTAFPTNRWRLSGVGYSFSNNVTLPAGGYLLLVNINPASFRTKYGIPTGVPVVGPYGGVLQDSGERLRLERPDAPETNGVPFIVVDEVRYNDRLPWPTGADGDGPSLQRRTPTAYGNEPTNWFASGITPGAANVFNQAPVCTLIQPTNQAEFSVPVDLTLTAQVSDADGTITRVEFYAGDVLLGMVTAAPYRYVWSNAPVGVHTLIAKARDNGLAVSASAPVSITINPPPIGSGVGLRGDYFDNADFTGTRVRRIDPMVNFDWGSGPPDGGIGADSFSVRWLGQVQPRFSETYTFYVVADDGVRLWVNNQLLIDRWIDQSPTEYSGFIQLQAGQLYDIKMDYYENGGGAVARLLWSAPSVPKEVIPSAQLYPPASSNLPPNITLTSPLNGADYAASSSVPLAANASDLDGAVLRVDYYAGTAKVAQATVAPFTAVWASAPAGTHTIQGVAVDDSGLSRTSAPVTITVRAGFSSNVTLISTGAVWKYLDNGSDQGSAWTAITFNDASWSSGPAQLGYGDGDERTVVGYGPDSGAKYITTYFRRSFVVSDPLVFNSLNLRVLRDDGVVVHLNGSEVYRDNLPGGAVNYQTAASAGISGADESTYYASPVNPGYLVPGTNVVAVEMHQNSGGSTDLSFDCELTGAQHSVAPHITVQPQSVTPMQGTSTALSVTAAGSAPLRYQWRKNGVKVYGATNATLAFPIVLPPHAGSYAVVITNIAGAVTSVVATLTVAPLDTDRDGMPDAWETAHGLSATDAADATLDNDGDGMSNLAEYLAGTNPRDPDSRLSILSVTADALGTSNGWVRLSWPSASNRLYEIQWAPSLSGTFLPRASNVTSTPPLNVFTDVAITNGGPGYYRLRVK